MSTAASLRIRRTLTLIVAIGALLLGFAAIRAASAWTAQAAPLVASPVAASAIEAKLGAEQARSADLEAQIGHDRRRPTSMAAALRVAQDGSDGWPACRPARKDLAAAKQRLKKLEASIKAAAARRTVTVVRTTSSSSSAGSVAPGRRERRR